MTYIIIDTKNKVSKYLKNKDLLQNDLIVFVYSNLCGPCHMFMSTWNELMKRVPNEDDKLYLKIEVSVLEDVKNENLTFYDKIVKRMFQLQSGVPNIAKYNKKTKRVISFKKERVLSALENFTVIRRKKYI